MKTACVIQARMGSMRFRGKVLAGIQGRPMLAHVVERCQAIPGVDAVMLSIPKGADDDALLWWAGKLGVIPHRGQEPLAGHPGINDVLRAYHRAAEAIQADVVMRVTADCPMLDPFLAGTVLAQLVAQSAPFASNCYPARTYPDGLDAEAFTSEFLRSANIAASDPSDREHCTPWMQREAGRALVNVVGLVGLEDLAAVRWTVDTAEDLAKIRRIAAHLPEGAYRLEDTRKAAEAAGVWP